MNLAKLRLLLDNFFTEKKIVASLIILGFVVYANSLFNPFVGDDDSQIVSNPLVHSITNIPKLLFGEVYNIGPANNLNVNYYKPLLPVTFAIIYSIFGESSFFFHLFQVTLHIANTIILFLIFRRIFARNLSIFLSLIFLVHPINSETVIYISALQDVMFLFLGLLAFYLYTFKRISVKKIVAINLLLFVSLLSKETGFLFFVILVIYGYLFRNKNFWKHTPYFLATFIVYLFMRFASTGIRIDQLKEAPIMYEPFISRIINLPSIFFFYIKTFFFPNNLITLQNWVIREVNFSSFFLPLIIVSVFILLVVALGIFLYQKSRQNIKYFI